MKQAFLLPLALLAALSVAQAQHKGKPNTEVVLSADSLLAVQPVPDTAPEFPGGEQALLRFLGQNVRYPAIAQRAGIQGTVVLSLTVLPDGRLQDIKVVQKVGGGLDQEAVRVAKLMPAWKPALLNNEPVAATRLLPVSFKLIVSR